MFCNQCEQTAKGTGCTIKGVCGKEDHTAVAQDTIIHALRGLARTALAAREKGIVDPATDDLTARALFMTLTNVNFDDVVLVQTLEAIIAHRKALAEKLGCDVASCATAASFTFENLKTVAPHPDSFADDPDVRSAMQLLLFGLKGVAAYTHHALLMGQRDPALFAFMYEALAAGMPDETGALDTSRELGAWLDLVLRCGKANLRAMELLETGNTSLFGHPKPTQVSRGHLAGPCILVSGHDLPDLHALLKQTEGTGINIYTHGEMLPAHGYPELHAFKHLAGHFGTAWQNQQRELPEFPGPVLFTTNCIQNPRDHAEQIFTSGATGWPGCVHCFGEDFSALIAKAKSMPGFSSAQEGPFVTVGFGRQTLLDAAPAVLEAVKSGAVRHIFLVGGCDGAKPGRNYYTEFVEQTPPDTLIMTLACGKFRFFDKELGHIGPFPRLLDVGQCNDAYAAVQVALALAKALDCSVNELPLSLVLSWYEQKAVSILLTLLALGVKNVRLGPSLPAFVSPNILNLLVSQWGITPISTPEADLKAILA